MLVVGEGHRGDEGDEPDGGGGEEDGEPEGEEVHGWGPCAAGGTAGDWALVTSCPLSLGPTSGVFAATPTPRLDEERFWVHLEFRICHEFAGLPERRHRYLWCDGFLPNEYLLDGRASRITGTAWIGDGPSQSEWDFALLVPRSVRSREEIDWASLLPRENMTRWMSFDEAKRYLEIDPAVAVPDLK
mgnify:CR=1 FL=1